MLAKILPGLVLILGGGYLGTVYASRFERRVRQLEAFRTALSQLEFDIRFLCLPLPQALEEVAKLQKGAVSKIFKSAAEGLTRQKSARVCDVWSDAAAKYRCDLCLTKQDWQAVSSFAQSLGSGDRESEIANIRAAQLKLKVAEDEAQSLAQKNSKLYRGLGLLAGIFAAVILL